jgi:hypothetical protein
MIRYEYREFFREMRWRLKSEEWGALRDSAARRAHVDPAEDIHVAFDETAIAETTVLMGVVVDPRRKGSGSDQTSGCRGSEKAKHEWSGGKST